MEFEDTLTIRLSAYLSQLVRDELRYIYSFDAEDPLFGCETDRLLWARNVLAYKTTVTAMLEYFEEYYAADEKELIAMLRKLRK